MTAIANLPDLRPSLLLDFANSGRVDPRIQCTRASSATCWGPDGKLRTVAANVPRIDHDPVTGKCLGLLSESQRSNLLTDSLALSGYTKGSSGTYSAGRIGIDGVTPSMRVVANALGNVSVSKSTTVVAGAYTASIYFCADAKPTRGVLLRVEEIQADGSKVIRQLPFSSASVIADGKWRRYDLTVTHAAAGTSSVYFVVDPGVGEQIDVCAAQYEAGAKASSYIPTAASSVTRAADVCKIDGVSFTSWYRQDEGTVFAEYRTASTEGGILSLDAGLASDRIALDAPTLTQFRVRSIVSGGVQCELKNTVAAYPATTRAGVAYRTDDFAACANGGAVSVDTSGMVPLANKLMVGTNADSGFALNGTIARIAYYPRRLTNEQLQRLTA